MSGLATATSPRPRTGARLDVDLTAVAHNTRLLADRATGELMAVVKADGFGHGAVDVARTALANGATRLGVTSIDEALALRAAALGAPVLSWLNPPDADFAEATRSGIDLAVPSLVHLAAAAAAGGARVHLHVDAGMARDGAEPSTWGQLCRSARRAELRGELEVVGVMGHLGCADDPADDCNARGRTRFAWALETARAAGLRPAHRHLAATAATLTDPRSHHTMSRVGAGLVGIDPSGTTRLRPAMTLTAPVLQVRRVRGGTPVGYGHAYRTPGATHLGLVPLGYADGLPRLASGRAEVLVRGLRRPVIGRISMDQLGGPRGAPPAPRAAPGPGGGRGAAGAPPGGVGGGGGGTIEHEIVTGIGARVLRVVRRPAHLRSLT